VSEDHDIVMMTENLTCENTIFLPFSTCHVYIALKQQFFHTNSQ